jgi:hypothetical protein
MEAATILHLLTIAIDPHKTTNGRLSQLRFEIEREDFFKKTMANLREA